MRAVTIALLCAALSGGAAAYVSAHHRTERQRLAQHFTGGDLRRAREVLVTYGCAGCHRIPGIPGARGQVGPALENLAGRIYISGSLTNTPENLVRWIQDPRAINPRTAMPVTGISEADARAAAAYLYAQ
jgi:cytochrome c